MALISGLYNRLIELFRILSGVVVFVIFVLIVADVLVRLAGLSPWTYSSGIVEYGLLWFAMLAAPWLTRIKGHVFIDAVAVLLPAPARKAMAKIVYLLCIASSAVFAWYSWDLLVIAFNQGLLDTRGEEMPLWTLLLPIPISFALVAVEFCRYLIGIDDMYRGDEAREGM